MRVNLIWLFLLLPVSVDACMAADSQTMLYKDVIQQDLLYRAEKGDSLQLVGARFGVDWRQIAALNHLKIDARLRKGEELRIVKSKIIPSGIDNGILINIPDRSLYYFENGRLIAYYPVGLGMIKPEWQTPSAVSFEVVKKIKDPTWVVPISIQDEMVKKGEDIKTIVPPGPDNPLGKYWLGLSIKGVGLHATILPNSIYQFRSHGCIRLLPDNAKSLFDIVPVGTEGRLIYQTVKVARTADGRIFLEVYRDFYHKGQDQRRIVRDIVEANGLSDRVDWDRVADVIKKKDGTAEEITLNAPLSDHKEAISHRGARGD